MESAPEVDPVSALMRVLGERWVMTLALADAQLAPYPTPLFYALDDGPTPRLIFASDPTSHHGTLLGQGPTDAAAAVYRETEDIEILAGVQLRGVVIRDDRLGDATASRLRARYLARHPQAGSILSAGRHHLYALTVTWAKLTDNRLGFGVHPILRFDLTVDEVEQSSA